VAEFEHSDMMAMSRQMEELGLTMVHLADHIKTIRLRITAELGADKADRFLIGVKQVLDGMNQIFELHLETAVLNILHADVPVDRSGVQN